MVLSCVLAHCVAARMHTSAVSELSPVCVNTDVLPVRIVDAVQALHLVAPFNKG